MEKSNIQIKSAFEIPEKELIEFYAQAFEDRMKYLPHIWRWLNRSDFYDNKTPLVIEKDGKVIAHTGLTGFNLWLAGKQKTACWMIDYKILPQFQRQGLGSALSKSLVSVADCSLGLPNEKSLGTLLKNGWKQYPHSFQVFCFAHIFNHPALIGKLPKIIRKTLNIIAFPFVFLIHRVNSYNKKRFKFEKLTDSNFAEFYRLYKESNAETPTVITPVRDEKYAHWRILQSPNREKYFVYLHKNFGAILLINNNHGEYIDVLWVSNNRNFGEIKKMIATLGIFALKRGIAYIRLYSTDNELVKFLKKNILSKIKSTYLVYFSKNEECFKEMEQNEFNLELLDSDMEHIR
ncbi:MAG: GNAT family N-acetyltransferase [Prevotellaceae bacterium]|jgi:GNAT superfamily N-acetyltransferase|nr:GNAT family N-acetyltransferase [Prevotellaceae bacterium]